MLKLDPNDPYDTQKDLMNNLLGAVFACMLGALLARKEKRLPKSTVTDPFVQRNFPNS